MDNLSRKKILAWLTQVEFTTIRHVARLFYGVRRDGIPAKARTTKPSKESTREYGLEPGYDSAKNILDAMCRTEVVVRGRVQPLIIRRKSKNKSNQDIFHLPGARIRNNEDTIYGHDMAVVNSAVLLKLTGELESFQRFWDEDQFAYYGERYNIWPDGLFGLKANPAYPIFLEIDFGTEWDKGQIVEKCKRYVEFANAHPTERFSVVFPTQGAYGETDERRIEKLLAAFETFRRQNMFLTCKLSEFVGDLKLMDGNPLAPIFRSPWTDTRNPLNPSAISLTELVKLPNGAT